MLYADVGTALEASVVTWADLKWIRDAWQGKIVVKGVHIGDDARRAIDAGADAVVVSNHGGRQLGRCARHDSRATGGGRGGTRADRGARGRRHPTRQRRRQRRCASAHKPCSSGAPTPMASAPPAKRACAVPSRSCAQTCCARSSCSDVRRRQRSIGRMSRSRTAGTSTPDRPSAFLQRSFTTRAPIPAIVKESERGRCTISNSACHDWPAP